MAERPMGIAKAGFRRWLRSLPPETEVDQRGFEEEEEGEGRPCPLQRYLVATTGEEWLVGCEHFGLVTLNHSLPAWAREFVDAVDCEPGPVTAARAMASNRRLSGRLRSHGAGRGDGAGRHERGGDLMRRQRDRKQRGPSEPGQVVPGVRLQWRGDEEAGVVRAFLKICDEDGEDRGQLAEVALAPLTADPQLWSDLQAAYAGYLRRLVARCLDAPEASVGAFPMTPPERLIGGE